MYLDLQGDKIKFKVVPSTYVRYFTKEDEIKLVEELYNGYTFNGGTARIEYIEKVGDKVEVHLTASKFYSLLTTTLLVNKERKGLPEEVLGFQKQVKGTGGLDTIDKVLNNKLLSNDVAVSVMVQDKNGDYVLARRGAKVSVGTTLLSTSVTGSVDEEDLKEENPIINAVKREMYEEVHIDEDDIEVSVKGLYIGEEKLQPVFICNVVYGGEFDDEWLDNSVLYSTENTYFNKVTPDELQDYRVAKGRLSEAGVFHINLIKQELENRRG